MSQMEKELKRGALHLADRGLTACRGLDMVLAGIGGLFVGLSLAGKLGLPFLQAYNVPFTPTQAFSGALLPKLPSWLGGSLNRMSHHLTRQIVWRAIMLSGWSGLRKSDLPDSVFMVDSVPHSRFLPRVEAVIHHGGAGTTAAGLRAGVPSVIIPFHGDQPFWGQRIAELGVGPVPIPRRRLSVERLAQAIEEAVTDQTMRQRAADLGSKIRAEDGIAREIAAVQHIEKHVSRPAGEMGFYDV